jgi:hypothetical protein
MKRDLFLMFDTNKCIFIIHMLQITGKMWVGYFLIKGAIHTEACLYRQISMWVTDLPEENWIAIKFFLHI